MISGWGQYPRIEAKVEAPRTISALKMAIAKGNAIARGNGRAYGDSAVSIQNTIEMKNFNKMLAFNSDSGQLTAEAGLLLSDLIETFLHRGWFPYVTPGTKFVTLGGMIAADVHGKNHHKEGSFGTYVDWIDILTADGSVLRCSRTANKELFEWTIGGMGLTGVIIRTAIRLRPISSCLIEQQTLVAQNIGHAIEIFEQSKDTTYSVAWIDCLKRGAETGRSIVMLGEHAGEPETSQQSRHTLQLRIKKPKFKIPFNLPSFTLNHISVRTFNAIYYWHAKRRPKRQVIDWNTFFYPLDAISGWNKLYGRQGFAQYQCVIPLNCAEIGLRELLDTVSGTKSGAFLAVLKRFGKQESRFSFPMEGYTLALDFPVNPKTLSLMDKLDAITMKYNGRTYLAKDSRMSRDLFQLTEPRAQDYKMYRESAFAANTFKSAQSQRLSI